MLHSPPMVHLSLTSETYGNIGEKAQMILVWMWATCIENALHPQLLRLTRVRPMSYN